MKWLIIPIYDDEDDDPREIAEDIHGTMLWRYDSPLGSMVSYPRKDSEPCVVTDKLPFNKDDLERD